MPPVKIMVVLLLSSPVMAGPYYYSTPWQQLPSQVGSLQQPAQQSRQHEPAAGNQLPAYRQPSKVYHFIVTFNQDTPTRNQQKSAPYQKTVYNQNRQTYQETFQHPTSDQSTRRSEKSYVPSQYVSIQQTNPYYGMRSYADPFTKPFTSYDAPITPIQAPNPMQQTNPYYGMRSYADQFTKPFTSYDAPITPIQAPNPPAQPRSIKSEYQNFLHEIAPQNGVNFDLQGQAKKQSHTKDIVNHAVLEPEILKVLEELLFKEESRRNDEELKKVETVGVPFSSYGVPINQRKVVGIALEPSIRSLPIGEITL